MRGEYRAAAFNLADTRRASDDWFSIEFSFDLSALGNTVKGVRIWVAAVTFSPAAPSGIATISRPAILVLD